MTKLINYTSEQKATLLQEMSIEQLNQLFAKGAPITLSRDLPKDIDYELIAAKMGQTGLSEEVILTIETNKTQAVLQDIILYCKGLDLSLVPFLQDELF